MIKKVLHNKAFIPKEGACDNNCPCCKLKKDWKRRNDSSNIAAALQPDIEFPISARAHKNCAEKVETKQAFYQYENDCYCTSKNNKTKPKLLQHPKTCITNNEPTRERKFKSKIGYGKYDKHMTDVKDLQCLALSPTNSRLDVEKYRKEQEIQAHLEEIEANQEYEDTLNNCEEISKDEFKSVEEFSKFRNEHFFETHSTDDILRSAPPHICKHEFELDGRLLPKPLNADAFGRSRCCICEKPISKFEKDSLSSKAQNIKAKFKSRPSTCIYFGAKNLQYEPIKSFAKIYRFGLVPRAIMIGGSNNQIQSKLNDDNLDKFHNLTGKLRIPQYCNSMALRQQKMFFNT